MHLSSKRLKVALIYGPLLHYRIALFNALGLKYDLTVFTTEYAGINEELAFEIEIVPAWHLGPIKFQPGLRQKLRRGAFDVCISFLDVCHLDTVAAVFLPVSPRTFCWGIWLTRSKLANYIRLCAVKRCEATLFYCWEHLQQSVNQGGAVEKLYVAPNTVAVSDTAPLEPKKPRDSIIFVGSLAPRKGLDRLLRVFAEAVPTMPKWVRLVIVGEGPERSRLENLVDELGLNSRVEIPGRINDPIKLSCYYAEAFLSVSLAQAGLSVLQSMGFGVPFLTVSDSISGGETLNIDHGVNGFVVEDSDAAISSALQALAFDTSLAAKMGAAAREHYQQYATIENYAQGFVDAIEGTRNARIWRAAEFSETKRSRGI